MFHAKSMSLTARVAGLTADCEGNPLGATGILALADACASLASIKELKLEGTWLRVPQMMLMLVDFIPSLCALCGTEACGLAQTETRTLADHILPRCSSLTSLDIKRTTSAWNHLYSRSVNPAFRTISRKRRDLAGSAQVTASVPRE